MKSSNPMFRNSIYEQSYALTERPMSISGTMNKLLLLSLIMLAGAGAVYYQFSLGHYDFVNILTTAGVIVSLIIAIVLAFNQKITPYLAPVYAMAQGAALSGISCFFERMYEGIVIQAVSITFIVVLAAALLFKMQIIKATERFKSTVLAATFAIFIFYIISFILMLFGVNIPYFTGTSPLSIGINALIACIAALNLIIDFDFIERGVQTPLPSYYEWYGAFGLLVTILWLYIEILRLLARTKNR